MAPKSRVPLLFAVLFGLTATARCDPASLPPDLKDIQQGSLTFSPAGSSACGAGNQCFAYTLPRWRTAQSVVEGTVQITLTAYQDGRQIGPALVSPPLGADNGNKYCFNVTPLLAAAMAAPGLDFVATAASRLPGPPPLILPTLTVGAIPWGREPGPNNDHAMDCTAPPGMAPGPGEAALLPRAEADTSVQIGLPRPTVVPGKPAPDFEVRDARGKLWRLADLRGKSNLLLTFFPKCFTGGCANHLSSLRDHEKEFQAAQTQILAVSVDSASGERGQLAFAEQWELPFPLVPDTERKLSLLYGAVQNPKQLSARMSIFIDRQGVVRLVDTNVLVRSHGEDILRQLRNLGLAPEVPLKDD